jgi:ethanolamine transporter EutH
MIQNVLKSLGGIEVIGVISIILFFACFLGVLLWTFFLKKSYVDTMSRLPLDKNAAAGADATELTQPDSRHE